MNLNDIRLPASLVCDLYQHHLVEPVAPATKQKQPGKTPAKAWTYLGKNEKGIGILVDYPNELYLPDADLQFMTNILQACKLNLGDVAIINYHKNKTSFAAIIEGVPCSSFLIFGVPAGALGLDAAPMFTSFIEQDCQVMFAPSATQLNSNEPDNKLLKSKLWLALKQMFGI